MNNIASLRSIFNSISLYLYIHTECTVKIVGVEFLVTFGFKIESEKLLFTFSTKVRAFYGIVFTFKDTGLARLEIALS